MNNEEIQEMMKKLQDAGLTPEDIADGILWPLFREGKMSKEDLGTLCGAIGLELDEDFDKDAGPEGDGATEGVTAEEAEAAKEIGPDESKEEFEEKLEEAKSDSDEEAADSSSDEEASDGDEEEEWEEAKKLFKL